MSHPYVTTRQKMNRRKMLQGTGVALGLPLFEAMTGTVADRAMARSVVDVPKKFVAVCATLGFHTPFLFPEEEGEGYSDTPYTSCLADHRDDFSL